MKNIILGITSLTLGSTVVGTVTSVHAAQSDKVIQMENVDNSSKNTKTLDAFEAEQILLNYGYTSFELEGTDATTLIISANEVLQRSWKSEVIKKLTKELEKHLGKDLTKKLAKHFGSILKLSRWLIAASEAGTHYIEHKVYDLCRHLGMSKKTSHIVANICSFLVETIA